MTEQEKRAAAAELERLKTYRAEREFCFKANVFRDADGLDCTNGGETSRFDQLYVFARRMSRNAALLYIEERGLNLEQCVWMIKRRPCGEDYLCAVPLAADRRDRWHMMGGNFIYSCDSRFFEVTENRYPVPVHDRIEE